MALMETKFTPILRFLFLPILLGAALPAVCQEVQNTLITSNHLEMQGTEDKNYFYFKGAVEVKGTNLQILCEELTVVAFREGSDTATIGNIGALEKIVARGGVEIHQAGRSAYAGKAEVNPAEGTVVLSEEPRVVDGDVEVSGYQFVLHKGDRKFESIPDPNAPIGQPSRSVVRLGAMPDLGFDQEEETVTVDDRIQESPVPEEATVPGQTTPEAGEGGPDANP